ncbi:MAG: hypothetical protein JXN65_07830 [Clostridia bacterium]|nr:hypothetical protein [Clostridia bacterium]
MKKLQIYMLIIVLATVFLVACEEPEETEQVYTGDELLDKMEGFWVFAGYKEGSDEYAKLQGIAYGIDSRGMDIYSNFELQNKDMQIDIKKGNTIVYYEGSERKEADVSFDTRDGYELMVLESVDGTTLYEKMRMSEYYLYEGFAENKSASYDASTYLSYELTDKDLEWYLEDTYWNEFYYIYPDGTTETMNSFMMVMYSSDRTGIMDYIDETINVTWEVYDQRLYLTYEDGETYYFPIDYEYDSETKYAYLYLYDTEEGYEGCAWVLWNYVGD